MDIRNCIAVMALFAVCFFVGMNCGPSCDDVNRIMQTDAYKIEARKYIGE